MILSNFNKRGQIHNYIAVIVFLFLIGFLSILGYLLMNELVTAYAASGHYGVAAAKAGEGFLFGLKVFDYTIIILMVCLIIGIGITSYKLAAPPIFFVVTIAMAAFLGFISYFFSYLFKEMVSDAIFAGTLLFFPRTVTICTNLHWVALACIIVGSITLYAKKPPTPGLMK